MALFHLVSSAIRARKPILMADTELDSQRRIRNLILLIFAGDGIWSLQENDLACALFAFGAGVVFLFVSERISKLQDRNA